MDDTLFTFFAEASDGTMPIIRMLCLLVCPVKEKIRLSPKIIKKQVIFAAVQLGFDTLHL